VFCVTAHPGAATTKQLIFHVGTRHIQMGTRQLLPVKPLYIASGKLTLLKYLFINLTILDFNLMNWVYDLPIIKQQKRRSFTLFGWEYLQAFRDTSVCALDDRSTFDGIYRNRKER
jgi:hypothetical protein